MIKEEKLFFFGPGHVTYIWIIFNGGYQYRYLEISVFKILYIVTVFIFFILSCILFSRIEYNFELF